MNEAQTLSYTRAQTATRLRIYQVLFAISIIAGLLAGLWCIFDPVGFAQLVFQIDPYPQTWPRIWGATLFGLACLGLVHTISYTTRLTTAFAFLSGWIRNISLNLPVRNKGSNYANPVYFMSPGGCSCLLAEIG